MIMSSRHTRHTLCLVPLLGYSRGCNTKQRKLDTLQGAGELDPMQALVDAKRQRLQDAGQLDPRQALIELSAKCQRLQGAGQLDRRQALVKSCSKRQRLQGAGELDPLWAVGFPTRSG